MYNKRLTKQNAMKGFVFFEESRLDLRLCTAI